MNTETAKAAPRSAEYPVLPWYQQPWAGVTSRVVAAIFGGYALTALCVGLLALILPLGKVEAVLAATMASFAFYAIAVMTALATRAWLFLLAPTLVLAAALWLLQSGAIA